MLRPNFTQGLQFGENPPANFANPSKICGGSEKSRKFAKLQSFAVQIRKRSERQKAQKKRGPKPPFVIFSRL
ncbi:hypothetical protein AKJ29_18045 [Aliiroseovarius crassostreae]|uniref:Uncharacterized protein n=1 Tax=Aliiroseovarius crassostreae TaxID=154981 RepID=A0A0P7KKQ6_9RHOB|nr:hypothetical protein [Aliiroseovarius crassostreae]KPN64506.1 hypothetical protein AKJ29_18045 [Aliiroseovarius crassostreae]